MQVVLGSRDEMDETANPYDGYDVSGDPLLFRGEVDERLPAFVRVAGVSSGDVGSTGVYDPVIDGRALAFSPQARATYGTGRQAAAGVSPPSPSTARSSVGPTPTARALSWVHHPPSGPPRRRPRRRVRR